MPSIHSEQKEEWKTNKECFYCIEARDDNEDDRTMLIKDLWFNLLPHTRNKPAEGSLHTQWQYSNYY
eukprot:scaffold8419_cov62-Attheya_sp.AAC.6